MYTTYLNHSRVSLHRATRSLLLKLCKTPPTVYTIIHDGMRFCVRWDHAQLD